MNGYLETLKKYVEFNGRARRTEYWMFQLINVLIAIGIAIFEAIVGSQGIIGIIFALAVLLPGLAVTIRRLHDIGRSGWWLLISLIPIIGTLVLIVFMFMEGDKGDNEFGTDPKASILEG